MENKKLHIFVGFKGGLGKSKLAKHIFPTVIYNVTGIQKFNIVEIDDTDTFDTWNSDKITFNKFTVDEYKDGIIQLQSTYADEDTCEILDIGGGKAKVMTILQQLQLMDLHLLYDLNFYVPTIKDATVFTSTKSTLETLHELFNVKANLIYNRVIFNYKNEFSTFFGNEKWGTTGKYDEIKDYIENEFVVYDDIDGQIETVLNELHISGFDFYLEALNFDKNYLQEFKNPNKTADERLQMGKQKSLVSDYLAFFKKVYLIDKDVNKKVKK